MEHPEQRARPRIDALLAGGAVQDRAAMNLAVAPTLRGRLCFAPPLDGVWTVGRWPAQARAVVKLEASVRDGRPPYCHSRHRR